MRRRFTLALAAWCLSVSAIVAGQTRATTADLGGTIVDQSSAVLPGATVTARNVDTNQVRSAITDERGHFLIPALAPGTYTVRAELAGFSPRTLDDVVETIRACARYRAHQSLGDSDAFLGLMIVDPRETTLHAGLCLRGEWRWLR